MYIFIKGKDKWIKGFVAKMYVRTESAESRYYFIGLVFLAEWLVQLGKFPNKLDSMNPDSVWLNLLFEMRALVPFEGQTEPNVHRNTWCHGWARELFEFTANTSI